MGGSVLRQAQDDGWGAQDDDWGARMKSIKMRLPCSPGLADADRYSVIVLWLARSLVTRRRCPKAVSADGAKAGSFDYLRIPRTLAATGIWSPFGYLSPSFSPQWESRALFGSCQECVGTSTYLLFGITLGTFRAFPLRLTGDNRALGAKDGRLTLVPAPFDVGVRLR